MKKQNHLKNLTWAIMILDYAKDLASVKEYIKSEKILTEIIKSNVNEEMVTQAIFEIAKIFETKMVITAFNLPLSGFYPHNPFLR